MAAIMRSNMKEYDKLVKELDGILDGKCLSYAHFALNKNIESVFFYNRYKSYGFTLEELTSFITYAKDMLPNTIACIKCGIRFIPKAKSVKRALCSTCKEALHKKGATTDSLKFKYPQWVKSIENQGIRKLVEQEFHIDEDIALKMSKAGSLEEARTIRADHWQSAPF